MRAARLSRFENQGGSSAAEGGREPASQPPVAGLSSAGSGRAASSAGPPAGPAPEVMGHVQTATFGAAPEGEESRAVDTGPSAAAPGPARTTSRSSAGAQSEEDALASQLRESGRQLREAREREEEDSAAGLAEFVGVSVADARAALEECSWDRQLAADRLLVRSSHASAPQRVASPASGLRFAVNQATAAPRPAGFDRPFRPPAQSFSAARMAHHGAARQRDPVGSALSGCMTGCALMACATAVTTFC